MKTTTRILHTVAEPELEAALDQARRDATALAWTTNFPALVLPELVREKEAKARGYWFKQQHIRRNSALLLENFLNSRSRLAA